MLLHFSFLQYFSNYNLQIILTFMGCIPDKDSKNNQNAYQQCSQQYKYKIPNINAILLRSSILKDHPAAETITKKLALNLFNILSSRRIIGFQLAFRASQHSYRAEEFHRLCKQKKLTVFIARTTKNYYFGAFTPCEWKNQEYLSYEQDQLGQSFIFKACDNQIQYFKLRHQCKNKAIMNDNDCGPIFGEGHDIIISDKCDKTKSWNNLGMSYESKQKYGSRKANKLLTGEQKYLLRDYQIWEIKTQ